MAEAQKRFPWRLTACAALSLLSALFVGFIETVGRQVTFIGRYEQIKEGMSLAETVQILGDPESAPHAATPGSLPYKVGVLDRRPPQLWNSVRRRPRAPQVPL
jgi:hypothetical protein